MVESSFLSRDEMADYGWERSNDRRKSLSLMPELDGGLIKLRFLKPVELPISG